VIITDTIRVLQNKKKKTRFLRSVVMAKSIPEKCKKLNALKIATHGNHFPTSVAISHNIALGKEMTPTMEMKDTTDHESKKRKTRILHDFLQHDHGQNRIQSAPTLFA